MTIGPSIENGFYYDFSCKKPFSEEDLAKIEKRMDEIVAENLPITHREVTRDEAISFFDKLGEHYKVELVNAIPEDPEDHALHAGRLHGSVPRASRAEHRCAEGA